MKQRITILKIIFSQFLLLIVGITSVVYARPIISQQNTPAAWSTKNIDAVSRKGTLIANGDALRIWGAGRDIEGTHDQFYYVYSSLVGNGQLVAQLVSQEATDGSARAGLMLRYGLADDASNIFLALTPQHGGALQWRGASGGANRHIAGSQGKMPLWMKLVRQDNTVTGWTSYNGSQWVKVDAVKIALPTTVYLGFAVTSHNVTRLSQAVFMHVQFSKTPVSPTPTPTPIPTTPVSPTAIRVYGQGNDFTANSVGVNTMSLNASDGVTLDCDGNLYVCDSRNNRVLYYPVGSTVPTRVYGQGGDFTTSTDEKGGISANSLEHPFGVGVDRSNNLYITDPENRRILYYLVGSTTAKKVYGQENSFSTTIINNGGVSAMSFFSPLGVVLDKNGNLYTADNENNRALMLPSV